MTIDPQTYEVDRILVRRYVNSNDQIAFSTLHQRYVSLVFNTCLRETRDRGLAEDCTQTVFLLLSRKSPSLLKVTNLAGWMYRAACQECRNAIRSEIRRKDRELNYVAATEPHFEELESTLHDALDQLKDSEREVLLLRFWQDLPHAQIASLLGLSESGARMKIERAIQQMRKKLGRLGVAVTTAVLIAFLSTRTTYATTNAGLEFLDSPLDVANSNIPNAIEFLQKLPTAVKVATVVIISGSAGMVFYLRLHAQIVSEKEIRNFFNQSVGNYSGTLEYADDQNGIHHKYKTRIKVKPLNLATYVIQASYVGSSGVDETILERDATTGTYKISVGGAGSTHQLDGTYEVKRAGEMGYVFTGLSPSRKAIVNLKFEHSGSQLTIEETYQKIGEKEVKFRNRYTLSK